MPNCDFYATQEDHESLLTWLFAEETCHIYELASDFERPLKRFTSASEVLAQFDREYTTGKKWHTVHLQLYVLGAGPAFTPRRIKLNPAACNGATFRYNADGWGLVQLYLHSVSQKDLESSHTNHNTQLRAEKWAPYNTDESKTPVEAWDFKKITAFSSRLNREIKKRSVATLNGRAVLASALNYYQTSAGLLELQQPHVNLVIK